MLLTHAANLLYDSALALLYPQRCAVCSGLVVRRSDGIACARCWSRVRFLEHSDTICWKCGALATAPVLQLTTEQEKQIRCRRCDAQEFDAARACGVYEGALRAAVISLKKEPSLCSRLSLLLQAVQAQPPLNTTTRIIPVPLHPIREKTRGFNQAAVIGTQLSRLAHLPLDESSLVRVAHSERHRAGMDAAARRESVANVFEVRYPRLVSGEHILLVDDVFTTGATVSACANVLRAAGADEVMVLTLARPEQY